MSAAPPTAAEIARRVARGETSAEAVTREHLDIIARRDRGLDAFLAVTAD
ncbi:MAG: amidase, partial [Acidobacteria bacterium]